MAEDSPARALARLRWNGVSKAARAEHGRMMARTRWAKARERVSLSRRLTRLQEAEETLQASQVGNSAPSTPVDPKV